MATDKAIYFKLRGLILASNMNFSGSIQYWAHQAKKNYHARVSDMEYSGYIYSSILFVLAFQTQPE